MEAVASKEEPIKAVALISDSAVTTVKAIAQAVGTIVAFEVTEP